MVLCNVTFYHRQMLQTIVFISPRSKTCNILIRKQTEGKPLSKWKKVALSVHECALPVILFYQNGEYVKNDLKKFWSMKQLKNSSLNSRDCNCFIIIETWLWNLKRHALPIGFQTGIGRNYVGTKVVYVVAIQVEKD